MFYVYCLVNLGAFEPWWQKIDATKAQRHKGFTMIGF